jgi:[acyl-carrier-protein] S-malonyltransferase
MKPAAQVIAQALEGIKIAPPSVPLIANVTAQPVSDPESISRLLVEQTTGAVQWYQSIKTMRTYGIDTMIECGTGNVLTNLNRRIDPTITSYTVNTPTQIETLIKNLL